MASTWVQDPPSKHSRHSAAASHGGRHTPSLSVRRSGELSRRSGDHRRSTEHQSRPASRASVDSKHDSGVPRTSRAGSTSGTNTHGQEGEGGEEEEKKNDLEFSMVACGFGHTMLVTENRSVMLTCGNHRHGQLGIDEKKTEITLRMCDECERVQARFKCNECQKDDSPETKRFCEACWQSAHKKKRNRCHRAREISPTPNKKFKDEPQPVQTMKTHAKLKLLQWEDPDTKKKYVLNKELNLWDLGPILQISCGDSHTLAIVGPNSVKDGVDVDYKRKDEKDSFGEVYSWGNGGSGRTGLCRREPMGGGKEGDVFYYQKTDPQATFVATKVLDCGRLCLEKLDEFEKERLKKLVGGVDDELPPDARAAAELPNQTSPHKGEGKDAPKSKDSESGAEAASSEPKCSQKGGVVEAELQPLRAIKVACGGQHSLVIDPNYELLSCGNNQRGQLGRKLESERSILKRINKDEHRTGSVEFDDDEEEDDDGDEARCSHIFFPVDMPAGSRKVTGIACGDLHCLALVSHGVQVFSWGCGLNGRLGHGDEKDSWTPRPLKTLGSLYQGDDRVGSIPQSFAIEDVSCGAAHSAAIDCEGQLFVWGSNSAGQCGPFKTQSVKEYNENNGQSLEAPDVLRPTYLELPEPKERKVEKEEEKGKTEGKTESQDKHPSRGPSSRVTSQPNTPRPTTNSHHTTPRSVAGSEYSKRSREMQAPLEKGAWSLSLNLKDQKGTSSLSLNFKDPMQTFHSLNPAKSMQKIRSLVPVKTLHALTFGRSDTLESKADSTKQPEPEKRLYKVACGESHTLALVNEYLYEVGNGMRRKYRRNNSYKKTVAGKKKGRLEEVIEIEDCFKPRQVEWCFSDTAEITTENPEPNRGDTRHDEPPWEVQCLQTFVQKQPDPDDPEAEAEEEEHITFTFTYSGDLDFGMDNEVSVVGFTGPRAPDGLKLISVEDGPWFEVLGQGKKLPDGTTVKKTQDDWDFHMKPHCKPPQDVLEGKADAKSKKWIECGYTFTVEIDKTRVSSEDSTYQGCVERAAWITNNVSTDNKSNMLVCKKTPLPVLKDISSGGFHAAAVSKEGLVFVWGMGALGRLGLGNELDQAVPVALEMSSFQVPGKIFFALQDVPGDDSFDYDQADSKAAEIKEIPPTSWRFKLDGDQLVLMGNKTNQRDDTGADTNQGQEATPEIGQGDITVGQWGLDDSAIGGQEDNDEELEQPWPDDPETPKDMRAEEHRQELKKLKDGDIVVSIDGHEVCFWAKEYEELEEENAKKEQERIDAQKKLEEGKRRSRESMKSKDHVQVDVPDGSDYTGQVDPEMAKLRWFKERAQKLLCGLEGSKAVIRIRRPQKSAGDHGAEPGGKGDMSSAAKAGTMDSSHLVMEGVRSLLSTFDSRASHGSHPRGPIVMPAAEGVQAGGKPDEEKWEGEGASDDGDEGDKGSSAKGGEQDLEFDIFLLRNEREPVPPDPKAHQKDGDKSKRGAVDCLGSKTPRSGTASRSRTPPGSTVTAGM